MSKVAPAPEPEGSAPPPPEPGTAVPPGSLFQAGNQQPQAESVAQVEQQGNDNDNNNNTAAANGGTSGDAPRSVSPVTAAATAEAAADVPAERTYPEHKKTTDIDKAWAHLSDAHPEDSLLDLLTGETVKDPIAKQKSHDTESITSENTIAERHKKAANAVQRSAFRKFGPELLKLVSPHTDVHHHDEKHANEGMESLVLKALRLRRDKHFANEIKGSVMDGKMSNWLLHSYAAPSMSTVPLIALITVWVVQYYEKLGATLSMLAFYQALARGFDVITDPAMSYFTDSFRSKWGRRRPFMLIGAVPYGLAFIMLMSPLPSLSPGGLSTWFGMCYIIFFLFNTFTNIPYDALAPELTDNQKDRQKLYFVCSLYDGVGMIIAIVLPVMLAMAIYPKQIPMVSTSCEVPVDGKIDISSCQMFHGSGRSLDSTFGSTLSADQECRSWAMDDTAANYGFNRTVCDACTVGQVATYEHADLMQYNFCQCMTDCKNVWVTDNDRRAYFAVGLFFGLWYMITMLNAGRIVRERAMLDGGATLPTPAPMMASLLNTFKNKAFTTLLPAWVCDALYAQIFLAILPFYIRYVIRPEFSNPEACSCGDEPLVGAPWFCSSDYILFISVVAIILCALIFMPMWLFIAKKLGKRNAWLLWSLTTAVTNSLFAFSGRGDYVSVIVFSGINGIPLGAKFLAEAILADVIDYDEFLTGARSEATYTMFKQFLPKIAAIPASAIPISLLGYFGHISPIDGVIQEQTDKRLVPYLYVVFVAIPTITALMAFGFKLRFPIKADIQNDKIIEGVAKHMIGLPADCPISGTPYRLYHMDDKTKAESYKIDNFMGVGIAKGLLEHPIKYIKKLKKRMEVQLGMGFVLLTCGSIMLGFTYKYFDTEVERNESAVDGVTGCSTESDDDFYPTGSGEGEGERKTETTDLGFIPVISMVLIGVSLTVIQWASLRMNAVLDLEKNPVRPKTLEKVVKQRRLKDKCGEFKVTACGGFTEESKSHIIPATRKLSASFNEDDDAADEAAGRASLSNVPKEAPDSQDGITVV